ncbi:MAG: hypothetical protein ABI208_06765 [Ginsengibacter sp.]|jgi:DNA polymerase III psi subunit
MSIDNIQLSSQLCKNLFTNQLISEKVTSESAPFLQNSKVASLGGNQKRITFLVNNAENSFLSESEMEMLTNLLTACKLTMEDVALINFNQCPNLNYEKLLTDFEPKKILVFGVTAAQLELPFHVPHFQLQKFQKEIYFLSPSFENFLTDIDLKKELWMGLQKLFLSK